MPETGAGRQMEIKKIDLQVLIFLLFLFLFEFRIQFLHALRADAVAELGIRMGTDIFFHFAPKPLVVADLLAVGADGDDATQCPDFVQGLLEPQVIFRESDLHVFAIGYVDDDPLEVKGLSIDIPLDHGVVIYPTYLAVFGDDAIFLMK